MDKLASLASITRAIQTLHQHKGDADTVVCLTWTIHQFGQWSSLFQLCKFTKLIEYVSYLVVQCNNIILSMCIYILLDMIC